MRPLRIALTADPELPVPPELYGGIERIVDLLATGLVERGHEVTLFANERSVSGGRLVGWRGGTSRSRIDTVRNATTLARHVLWGRHDVVHSFSRLAYLTPILPVPIPKLMSFQREISPATVRIAHRLSRSTLQFSALSERMMSSVSHIGSWHLIPNAVSLPSYSFRANVHDDAPLIFLGRVEAIKGPHIAIEIARRTGRKLIIAGNIPVGHRHWFEEFVLPHLDDRNIRYIGPVNDIQKSKLLGSAAALLMPILWEEPFGIVMIEAMACGTPVIGFRRGAVSEVVQDGTTGFVCDDVESAAAAVGRVVEIQRLACRDRVERLYSADTVVDQYCRLYSRMIAGTDACEFV